MGEIVNPYIAGAPVTEQRMFFGREDIFQWIENSIAGQYADHILVVHGQRRVGKTSVLKQLGNRLPKRFIPVFFDLQGRTHTTLDHFLWWLAREIVRVLRQDRGIESPPPDQQAFSADPEYFENQFLTGLRSALGNNTLLLTFDEFDNLEESGVKEELARPLVDHLRRLMGQPNLNFIFSIGSSGRKLENMQAAYTDFFKTALYKKISFLNEEQTHKLVTRPVEGVLEYERGAVDRIYSVTSGHPYFTQLTCHELFARCQRTEQRRIAKADVEAVLDDVVERGTVNLKFVWDEATDIEKWSLAALAQLDKTDHRAVADYLRKNRVRFSETDLTSGLLHLREKDVLTPDNRFVIHLLKLWLQKNRPIEQAREELTEANPIASRFIEIGLEFRDGGQYEKAIEYFRQALSVSSDNLQAQVNIALTYAAQGQLEQAVVEFEKALVLDDEDVASRAGLCEAHLKLGDAAMKRGRTKEAALSYQRVLEINAEHTEARQRMAEISRQRAEKALTDGRDEDALNAFAEALKYTPEDEILSARVEAVRAEKKAKIIASLVSRSEREARELNWDGAIRTLEEAVALSPEDSDIQKKLSNARDERHQQKLADLKARAQGLANAEKFDEALKTWQEYLSLAPNASEQVEEEMIRIKSNQELFELYTTAGQALASRNFDQAIKLLKEVIYRDENYRDASRLLTKAIESRRTGTTQKLGKSRKKPVPTQPIRAQVAPKMGGKRIGIIGGLVVILVLAVAGIFFGPKLWDNISTGIQQTAGVTPTGTLHITDATPTILPEVASIEPILAYISGTQPDFEDDFSSDKWGDLAEGISTKNLLKDGVLNLVLEAGTNSEKLGLGGPNFQASQFALELDFYFEGSSGSSDLFVGFPSQANEINCDFHINLDKQEWSVVLDNETINGGDVNENLKGQWAHLQVIYSGTQLVTFLNGKFLGSTEGVNHYGQDNWIFVTAPEGQAKVRLDNIKFWNLETFASSSAVAPTSTPDSRILNPANQHLYLLSMTEATWHVANFSCTQLGGHLVTIQNPEENNFIITLKAGKSIWLGATDATEEETWVWVNGEPWEYTNWGGGQPDNILDREDVLSFGDTAWNDLDEFESLFFVCEWESADSSITPTVSLSPTQKGSAFYEPILAAIKNREPDFQDEFSGSAGGWFFESETDDGLSNMSMQNGALSMIVGPFNMGWSRNSSLRFQKFVLQVEANFPNRGGDIMILFGHNPYSKDEWAFHLNEFGQWKLVFSDDTGNNIITSSMKTMDIPQEEAIVTILSNGKECAVYLNDVPLAYSADDRLGSGNEIRLGVDNGNGVSITAILYNIIKIWNLDGIQGLP